MVAAGLAQHRCAIEGFVGQSGGRLLRGKLLERLRGFGRLVELLKLGRRLEEGAVAERRLGGVPGYCLHQPRRGFGLPRSRQPFSDLEFGQGAETAGAFAIMGRIRKLLLQGGEPAVGFLKAAIVKVALPRIQRRAQIIGALRSEIDDVFVDPCRRGEVVQLVQGLAQFHQDLVVIFALREEGDELVGRQKQAALGGTRHRQAQRIAAADESGDSHPERVPAAVATEQLVVAQDAVVGGVMAVPGRVVLGQHRRVRRDRPGIVAACIIALGEEIANFRAIGRRAVFVEIILVLFNGDLVIADAAVTLGFALIIETEAAQSGPGQAVRLLMYRACGMLHQPKTARGELLHDALARQDGLGLAAVRFVIVHHLLQQLRGVFIKGIEREQDLLGGDRFRVIGAFLIQRRQLDEDGQGVALVRTRGEKILRRCRAAVFGIAAGDILDGLGAEIRPRPAELLRVGTFDQRHVLEQIDKAGDGVRVITLGVVGPAEFVERHVEIGVIPLFEQGFVMVDSGGVLAAVEIKLGDAEMGFESDR